MRLGDAWVIPDQFEDPLLGLVGFIPHFKAVDKIEGDREKIRAVRFIVTFIVSFIVTFAERWKTKEIAVT